MHAPWQGLSPISGWSWSGRRLKSWRPRAGLWVRTRRYIVWKNHNSRREDVMCSLFAHQPQRDYESQTRSLRIDGHCTSIRLEMSFWDTLEEIAAKEGMTLAKFLTTLHN